MIRCLIRAGADIHAKNAKGLTPLDVALQYGPTEAVDLLIDAGASFWDVQGGTSDLTLLRYQMVRMGQTALNFPYPMAGHGGGISWLSKPEH